jgi:hypothetical protein
VIHPIAPNPASDSTHVLGSGTGATPPSDAESIDKSGVMPAKGTPGLPAVLVTSTRIVPEKLSGWSLLPSTSTGPLSIEKASAGAPCTRIA